jgi:stearoyl-CoA desaturase (Delta-9 desaturase)
MIAILYTLAMTHITIICVTLYLHRGQAHKGILFHPVLEHFMRFWLWLTTGMVTKQWVAIHRLHHQKCEKPGDPHSPHVYGIKNIFFRGVYYYYLASKDANMILQYGKGTPNDWIERKVYTPHHHLGILLMLIIDLALFGPWGFIVWGVQMLWIPFFAAGVINGLGHWWGYRNHNTKDHSRNIMPWCVLIGGESLHNNHHNDPASPKLSNRWWEFDAGWFWLQIFRLLRLAKLRYQ